MLGLGAGLIYTPPTLPRTLYRHGYGLCRNRHRCNRGVLSFSGAKVKIDTDEEIGPAGSAVRREGKIVIHSPSEYGSCMLYIGGSELVIGPMAYHRKNNY